MLMGSALYGVALMIVSQASNLGEACIGLFIAGGGSIIAMTTAFATFQGVLPAWVRGRGLSVAMLVVWLVTSPAAYLWGVVASKEGVDTALLVAGVGAVIVAVAAVPLLSISGMDDVDITPVPPAMPLIALEPAASDGPVLVTVEWRIDPARAEEFADAMRRVRRIRRRDGAISWGLFHDLAEPGRMVETFSVASWAEHERQHGRTTVGDAEALAIPRSMLVGDDPTVTHLVGAHGSSPTAHSD